jgi:uncharacterized protein YdiU (UPF0061 family)
MKSKLGLFNNDESDIELIHNLEDNLQLTETDMTIFFRVLSNFKKANVALELIENAFYDVNHIAEEIKISWNNWFLKYQNRLEKENLTHLERKEKMDAVNPKYILRNYMAQLAIDDANKGDYKLIDELYQLLKKPYKEQPENEKWFAKRPEWARNKIGCSMLSCSS